MDRTITNKECILAQAKIIASRFGLQNLNIRQLAEACKISVGTVYNYFPSKDDLLVETIEAIWLDVLYDTIQTLSEDDFLRNIEDLYKSFHEGCLPYPDFLVLHSMGLGVKGRRKGRAVMDQIFQLMKAGLLTSLEGDPRVKQEVFSPPVTREAFVDLVLVNIVTSVIRDIDKGHLVVEVVKRTVY